MNDVLKKLGFPLDKQKASLGSERKPEVFTALSDGVITRLNILIA